MAFLDGPNVTREEVYRRLGVPHGTYEGTTVAAYRLGLTRGAYYVLGPAPGWEDARYSLLVEFDQRDLLTAHHLIDVRSP